MYFATPKRDELLIRIECHMAGCLNTFGSTGIKACWTAKHRKTKEALVKGWGYIPFEPEQVICLVPDRRRSRRIRISISQFTDSEYGETLTTL